MISASHAIARFHRDLALGTLLKAILGSAAIATLVLGQFVSFGPIDATVLLALIGGVWLLLSFQSLRGSRLAAGSSMLIATGQYEQAEQHLAAALRTFSLFRTVKLLALHHLALLRHAQRRWQDAAALSQALLGQRLGALDYLSKPSRLILADSLLELGDMRGAQEAIGGLYQYRLTLGEALQLLVVQLDHQHRTGQWELMLQGVRSKVQLAELMPTEQAARTQAFLALAAKKTGCAELCEWLRKRVELLTDVSRLTQVRPLLWEVWGKE